MGKILLLIVSLLAFGSGAQSADKLALEALSDLENFQVDNARMMSAGLPKQSHFAALKGLGVNKVIDLIPGDRDEHARMVSELDLAYHNIAVDWHNPTIENFREYVAVMQMSDNEEGITLTHCRLNWRGAVFTYLYRVTQLKEPEALVRKNMLAIWKPNGTWLQFIESVMAEY